MNVNELNRQIQTIKKIIKATPPELYGKHQDTIAEFYNTVTNMESEIKTSIEEIKSIKDKINSVISNNQGKILSIMSALKR